MSKQTLIRLYIKGGILSVSDLRKIATIALRYGIPKLRLGSRQDLILPCPIKEAGNLLRSLSKELPYTITRDNDDSKNIMSSYPAATIFPTLGWANEGLFQEIIGLFDYTPQLKINITDASQKLVHPFTGDLNFIASEDENYWHLFVKTPENNLFQWPELIYGHDIPKVSRLLEHEWPISRKGDALSFQDVWEEQFIRSIPSGKHPPFNDSGIPYYEGFHNYGRRYWLGIADRNNSYDTRFLDALGLLCFKTGKGYISITPWQSFIIKDIKEENLVAWEKLLGLFGINTSHSSLELNWALPDAAPWALQLKKYIVRQFEKTKIRTEGISFGVGKAYEGHTVFYIQQTPLFSIAGKGFFNTYSVRHTENFNPVSTSYTTYASGLRKANLPDVLLFLSQQYYESLGTKDTTEQKTNKPEEKEQQWVYQCSECLTIYDETTGDESQGIQAGTSFSSLPATYCCSLCDAQKNTFIKINKASLQPA